MKWKNQSLRPETRIKLDKFVPRDYQLPILDAIENKGYKKVVAIMPRRCLAKNTHITLACGATKLIQDIKKGDKVLSFNGEKIVTDVVKNCWYVGKKEAIEIKSSKFPNIISSKDHKFFSKDKWIKASELKYFTKLYHQYKFEYKSIDNSLLVEFIGFLTHDGYVSLYQQPKFTNKNKEILKRVEYLAKKLFGYSVIWRKKGNCYDLGITNGTKGGGTFKNEVKELFRKHGLDIPKSKKRIHPEIWKASREAVLTYLRAVISCDGSIYLREAESRKIKGIVKKIKTTCEITISCGKSYWLAQDTYWLLRKIGIIGQTPKLERKSNWKIKVGRSNDVIEILSGHIYGKNSLALKVLREISLSKRSNAIHYNEELVVMTRNKQENVGVLDMYDIETKNNHNFFANGYLVHNSGKDIVAFNLAIRQALRKICIIYYIFPTYSQARKALWDAITIEGKRILDFIPAELIESKNSSEMKITFINGSIIQFIGSDRYDRLVGTNPYGCIFSEYALQDPRAYKFIRPILAANNGWCLMVSTPRGKNNLWELYQIAQGSPEWFAYRITLDTTKHIPLQEIERERAEGIMSEDLIQQEYYVSFDAGIEGAYYTKYIDKMKINNQITSVPWESSFPVHTAWDIGVRDSTAIIFFQTIGQSVRIIDCYENNKHGLEHYVNIIKQKSYTYGKHIAPHDIAVREFGTGMTRIEKAKRLGIKFTVAPKLSIEDGIEAVRSTFSKVWIDEDNCAQLIKALENYRQEWDAKKKIYKSMPLHDYSSHFSDGMRYLCVTLPKTRDGLSAEDLEKRYREAVYGEQSNIPSIFRDDIRRY